MGITLSLLKRERPFDVYMSQRAKRILPAYYLVMVPYTLALTLCGRARLSAVFWNAVLLYYWENPQGKFNWYIAAIMVFYLIAPFIIKMMRSSVHKEFVALLVAVFGIALTMLLILDNDFLHLDLSMRIPIFGIGCLIGCYIYEQRGFFIKDALFWTGMFAMGLVYYRYYSHSPIYLPLCFLFIFTTVPVCLLISHLFAIANVPHIRSFLIMIGTASLEIYLLNVSLFSEHAFVMRLLGGIDGNGYAALSFALNILLGVLLHQAMKQISAGK